MRSIDEAFDYAARLVQALQVRGSMVTTVESCTGGMIAMALTALSSFFISTIQWIGPFSPLHLLSIISLISLLIAYRAAHRGDVKSHSRTLLSLVIFALIIPGIFTLFPGRLMYRVVFGG